EHAVLRVLLAVGVVELVPVPVSLRNLGRAVGCPGLAPFHQLARVQPQPHRAAQLRDVVLLVQEAHDGMPAAAVDLRRAGVLQPQYVPRELDHRALQPQANAEEWHAPLAGIADRLDLPLDAPVTEPTGDEHAIDAGQHLLGSVTLDLLGIDTPDDDPGRL